MALSISQNTDAKDVLALACGLWVVLCARIRRIYTETFATVHLLLAEWKTMVREIVDAKRHIAMECHSVRRF
jgi:hypothetical protein